MFCRVNVLLISSRFDGAVNHLLVVFVEILEIRPKNELFSTVGLFFVFCRGKYFNI